MVGTMKSNYFIGQLTKPTGDLSSKMSDKCRTLKKVMLPSLENKF